MLLLQHITYFHQNRDLLIDNVNLSISKNSKSALIGNNGSGKSTLLKIASGELQPSAGVVRTEARPYYVPQIFGQFNELTIAQALRIDQKLTALEKILEGNLTETDLELLNDDWTIAERCSEALIEWGLPDVPLNQKMETLSGGQKTKVFLAGITVHEPDVVLLDEPSNHLDIESRSKLYEYIVSTAHALLVVSHDRTLLNLLDAVYELGKGGLTLYGGNYDFYTSQKEIETNALEQDLQSKEKALRKARITERESIERQQKLDARGKKKQEKAGLPTISMNTFRNNAEKSTSRIKGFHAEKVGQISQELTSLRKELPGIDKMKINLDNASMHNGKVLITASEINFQYENANLWIQPLTFQIHSGERVAIRGHNGSGKTTLIKIILGKLLPQSGQMDRADMHSIYIDQDYALIDNGLTVYQQAQDYNSGALQEHEIKIRLNRFLFGKNDWNKRCADLSGGEKMRLILCCLTISNQAPDMIILDEPTNNLDIQNTLILTQAINEYEGTIIVISHDSYFLKEIHAERMIDL